MLWLAITDSSSRCAPARRTTKAPGAPSRLASNRATASGPVGSTDTATRHAAARRRFGKSLQGRTKKNRAPEAPVSALAPARVRVMVSEARQPWVNSRIPAASARNRSVGLCSSPPATIPGASCPVGIRTPCIPPCSARARDAATASLAAETNPP